MGGLGFERGRLVGVGVRRDAVETDHAGGSEGRAINRSNRFAREKRRRNNRRNSSVASSSRRASLGPVVVRLALLRAPRRGPSRAALIRRALRLPPAEVLELDEVAPFVLQLDARASPAASERADDRRGSSRGEARRRQRSLEGIHRGTRDAGRGEGDGGGDRSIRARAPPPRPRRRDDKANSAHGRRDDSPTTVYPRPESPSRGMK